MRIRSLLSRSKAYFRQLLQRREFQDNPWQQTQNDFMMQCFVKHKVVVKGVLHVGGHLGEEYPIYQKAGAEGVVFFEPMPDIFAALSKRLKGRGDVVLVGKALGSKNEKRRIHVGKGSGESTSFLKPTDLYHGHFEETPVYLEIFTLDSIFSSLSNNRIFNMLVTDTQGFDLEVLKGAEKTLEQIDYIYTEASRGHYHGEPSLEDFDLFLTPRGFRRAETSMYGSWKGTDQWGDIFYMRDRKVNS